VRVLLAVLVGAAAAGCDAVAERPASRTPSTAPPPPAEAFDQRLNSREHPPPVSSNRNPFRFDVGEPARRSALRPLPPPDGLPEVPLPIAAPPLRLLGIATQTDGSRVAVMLVGGDLVLARQGERLASRYTVAAIGDESVELTDAVGERPMRLDLP
jgi:hypothetical protein